MRSIVYGFSRPRKWKPFAAAIMWADRKEYLQGEQKISHAYTKILRRNGRPNLIYHAAGHSSHFMGEAHFLTLNIPVEEYLVEVPDDIFDDIVDDCINKEGLPYALKQVIGKGIVYILSLFKIKCKNPFKKYEDCIESQSKLVSKALNIDVPIDMDNARVKFYRDWFCNLPGVKRIR